MNINAFACTLIALNLFSLKENIAAVYYDYNNENDNGNSATPSLISAKLGTPPLKKLRVASTPSPQSTRKHVALETFKQDMSKKIAGIKFDEFSKGMKLISESHTKYRNWSNALEQQGLTPEQSVEIQCYMQHYVDKINRIEQIVKDIVSYNDYSIWYLTPPPHQRTVTFADDRNTILPGADLYESDPIFIIEDPEYKFNWHWSTFASKKIPMKHDLPLKSLLIKEKPSQYMEYVYAETALKAIAHIEYHAYQNNNGHFNYLVGLIREHEDDEAKFSETCKNIFDNKSSNYLIQHYEKAKASYVTTQAQREYRHLFGVDAQSLIRSFNAWTERHGLQT